MVQIIAPSPRAMQQGQIGQQIGLGLAKKLGLGEAEQAFQQAGNDPVKLATALARLTATVPELERSAGQIYQNMLARTGQEEKAKGLTPPGELPTNANLQGDIQQEGAVPPGDTLTSTPATAKSPPIPKGKMDNEAIADEYLFTMRPDLAETQGRYFVPTFDMEIKSNLRPEEEGQMRQSLLDRGIKNPQSQEEIIDIARKNAQAKYKEAFDKWDITKQGAQAINQNWKNFTEGAPERLTPFLSRYQQQGLNSTVDDLKNKYFQYASRLPVNYSPEQMHTSAMSNLQKDLNDIDALQNVTSMPPIRQISDAKSYMNTIAEEYKPLFERGYYNTLREDAFVNKDMGNEEFHSALFGENTNKDQLNKIHSVPYPKRKTIPSPQGGVLLPANKKDVEKYRNDLAKVLQNMGDKDDLILQRAMAFDSGATIEDFQQALNIAKKNGLKLSEFQKSQESEVGIPRVPPLWEIFSPKNAGTGLFGLSEFMVKPFINYLRGKK